MPVQTRQDPLQRMEHLALSIGNILETRALQLGDVVVLIQDPSYTCFELVGSVVEIDTPRSLVQLQASSRHLSVPNRQIGYALDPVGWSPLQQQQFAWLVAARMGELVGHTGFEPGDPIIVTKGAVPEAWFDGTYLEFYQHHPSKLADMSHVKVTFYNSIYNEQQERIVGSSEMGYRHPASPAFTPRQRILFNQLMENYYAHFGRAYISACHPRQDSQTPESGQ